MKAVCSAVATAGMCVLASAVMSTACPPPASQVYVSGEISGFTGVLDIWGTVYANISSPTLNPPPLVVNINQSNYTKHASLRWTGGSGFGSGGTLALESTMTAADSCCKWHSIRASGSMDVWVLGQPGTRYKLRRSTSYSASSFLSNPNSDISLQRPGSFSPAAAPAGGAIHVGRTSSTTRTIANKVYSLAETWGAAADTLIVMGYGGGGPYVTSMVSERRGVSVDTLTPDPITFVLTIGVRDTAPGGWHRGDLGAAGVANAFARCQTSGTLSSVQVSQLAFNSTDGDGTQIEPAIVNQVAAIRALAMPGDTLVVYWESHGFSAPIGSESLLSWNLGPDEGYHPGMDITSNGLQHAYFHYRPPLYDEPTLSGLLNANAADYAVTPGNLSEVDFAEIFSGGVLDCMNKVFVAGQCFGDGFWTSLKNLPQTALIASGRIDGGYPLATCSIGGTADIGRDLATVIGATPCPTPGQSLNLSRLVEQMQILSDNTRAVHVGPTYRLDPAWWNRPLPGVVPPLTYSVRANRTFNSKMFALCLADLTSPGGGEERDGRLTADDLIAFLDAYFSANLLVADVALLGGVPGKDGTLTADDLILYVGSFLTNCQ